MPTFAKVDTNKKKNWKHSTETFEKHALAEELEAKQSQLKELKTDFHDVYQQVRAVFTPLCLVAVTHTLTLLRRKALDNLMITHSKTFE